MSDILLILWAIFFSGDLAPLESTSLNSPQVELEMWTFADGQDVFSWTLQDFENQNPSVSVQLKVFDDENSLHNALKNKTPDVFMIKSTWLVDFLPKLSSFDVQIDEIQTDFYPIAQDFVQNEQVWTMPFYLNSWALYYNPFLLENDKIVVGDKPPSTWSEFLSAKNKYDELGQTKTGFMAPSQARELFLLLSLQGGSEGLGDALGFLKLMFEGEGYKKEFDIKEFKMGKVAVALADNQEDAALMLSSIFPSGKQIVPQVDSELLTLGEAWGFAVSSKEDLAMELAEFLTSETNMQSFYSKTLKIPLRRGIAAGFWADNAEIARSFRDLDFELIKEFLQGKKASADIIEIFSK